MIRPKRLIVGDKVAVVSLSWGGFGDDSYIHKYHIAKERLKNEFGLEVIPMPHALKGSEFVSRHPTALVGFIVWSPRAPSRMTLT